MTSTFVCQNAIFFHFRTCCPPYTVVEAADFGTDLVAFWISARRFIQEAHFMSVVGGSALFRAVLNDDISALR